jgi:hypothetical protein
MVWHAWRLVVLLQLESLGRPSAPLELGNSVHSCIHRREKGKNIGSVKDADAAAV